MMQTDLLRWAAANPKKLAVEGRRRSLSYAELAHNARRFAAGLRALDLPQGWPIGLLVADTPEYAESLCGAWLAGRPVISLSRPRFEGDFESDCWRTKSMILIAGDADLPLLEPLLRADARGPIVFVVGESNDFRAFTALMGDHALQDLAPPQRCPDLVQCAWNHASRRRHVRLSEEVLRAQLQHLEHQLGPISSGDQLCLQPPGSQVHTLALLSSISNGSTFANLCGPDLDTVLARFQRTQRARLWGMPEDYSALLEQASEAPRIPHSPERRVVALAPMRHELCLRAQERFGAAVHTSYGPIEAMHVACWQSTEHQKPGAVGKPGPGVQLVIIDDYQKVARQGETGWLVMRGDGLAESEHWNTFDRKSPECRWLGTAEQGYLDADGTLHVTGTGPWVTRSGERLRTYRVEDAFYRLPAVAGAYVFGAGVPFFDEVLQAVVELVPGSKHTVFDLHAELSRLLPAHQLPDRYVIVPYLPLTPSGVPARLLMRQTPYAWVTVTAREA